ncbi:MAG: hypothetical protein JWO86_5570 [Myxococcaceae bacterium]|nr:hypothetical protein [Myxococcaceae bacterium]
MRMAFRTVLSVVLLNGVAAIGCGGPAAPPAPVAPLEPLPASASAPVPVSSAPPLADAGSAAAPDTDADRAKALAAYAWELGKFLHDRWQIPTSISVAEAHRRCVTFQVSVSRALVIWHVKREPIRPSGNALFDDSARTMLEKAMEDKAHLPEPPPAFDDMFRGRTLVISMPGDPHSAPSTCK